MSRKILRRYHQTILKISYCVFLVTGLTYLVSTQTYLVALAYALGLTLLFHVLLKNADRVLSPDPDFVAAQLTSDFHLGKFIVKAIGFFFFSVGSGLFLLGVVAYFQNSHGLDWLAFFGTLGIFPFLLGISLMKRAK
jgi:hypothetical protein